MNIINVPIVEFYKNCIPVARDSGFTYIVSLIARDADIFELYDNLLKQWNSLDSITGRNFLFIIAGNESSEHVDENSLIHLINSYGCCKYNRYIKISNQVGEPLNTRRGSNNLYQQDIEENQTVAVNKLKEYFCIKESQIPCLVFKDISSQRYKNIIIPITKNNLYQYFKKLFNDIDYLLSELELINEQLKEKRDDDLITKRKYIISEINNMIRDSRMYTIKRHKQKESYQIFNNYEHINNYGEINTQNKVTNEVNLDVINALIDDILKQLASINTSINAKEIMMEVKEDLNNEPDKSILAKIKKKLMPLKDIAEIGSIIAAIIDLISKL